MANIFQAIYDFFASIVELIVSTFSTIFHTLKGAAEGILNLLLSFVNLFEGVLKGAIDVVGGVGKFIASNIIVLGIIGVGAYAFLRYQAQQGKPVTVGGKKLN